MEYLVQKACQNGQKVAGVDATIYQAASTPATFWSFWHIPFTVRHVLHKSTQADMTTLAKEWVGWLQRYYYINLCNSRGGCIYEDYLIWGQCRTAYFSTWKIFLSAPLQCISNTIHKLNLYQSEVCQTPICLWCKSFGVHICSLWCVVSCELRNMKLCEVECYIQRFCILYYVNICHIGHVAGTCSVGITNSSIAMIISLVILVVWVQQ